jgi:hypothetical protein
MTEPLTIKDLNCSTCPNKEMRHSYGYDRDRPSCKLTKWFLDFPNPDETIVKDFVGVVGCASHPLALQVLAGPVIAELEHMRGGFYVGVRGEGFIHGISTAISLLKEGVH